MGELRGQALLEAFDRATAVKLALADEFKRAHLPVEGVSNVFAAGVDLPAVAVTLSRDPTADEIPLLPNERNGVPVIYYTVRDGVTLKYNNWAPSA